MGKIQERKPSGRPKKFTEESEQVGFKVPKSKVEEFKAYCNEYLNKLVVGGKKEKAPKKAIAPKPKPESSIKEKPANTCDCYIDTNGLLRRGKIACKKNKSQHNF